MLGRFSYSWQYGMFLSQFPVFLACIFSKDGPYLLLFLSQYLSERVSKERNQDKIDRMEEGKEFCFVGMHSDETLRPVEI
jgi:hypothetical protein